MLGASEATDFHGVATPSKAWRLASCQVSIAGSDTRNAFRRSEFRKGLGLDQIPKISRFKTKAAGTTQSATRKNTFLRAAVCLESTTITAVNSRH